MYFTLTGPQTFTATYGGSKGQPFTARSLGGVETYNSFLKETHYKSPQLLFKFKGDSL